MEKLRAVIPGCSTVEYDLEEYKGPEGCAYTTPNDFEGHPEWNPANISDQQVKLFFSKLKTSTGCTIVEGDTLTCTYPAPIDMITVNRSSSDLPLRPCTEYIDLNGLDDKGEELYMLGFRESDPAIYYDDAVKYYVKPSTKAEYIYNTETQKWEKESDK